MEITLAAGYNRRFETSYLLKRPSLVRRYYAGKFKGWIWQDPSLALISKSLTPSPWGTLRYHNFTACGRRELFGFGREIWLKRRYLYRQMTFFRPAVIPICRSQWPRGLRRRSAAARLLKLWIRTPPGAWMSVCCEFCVLSGRGLCDELITRPEESCWVWCVIVCDLENSWMRRPWPTGGCCAKRKKEIPI